MWGIPARKDCYISQHGSVTTYTLQGFDRAQECSFIKKINNFISYDFFLWVVYGLQRWTYNLYEGRSESNASYLFPWKLQ